MRYIKVSKTFAESNQGAVVERDRFNYGKTLAGDYFVDVNTLKTHPELFEGSEVEYIDLERDDIEMPPAPKV